MKLSVVLTVDFPKTSQINALVPHSPDWHVFEREDGHRAMSAVLDSKRLCGLVYLLGLVNLEETSQTIGLTSAEGSAFAFKMYVTPERGFDGEKWEEIVSKIRRQG